MLLQEIFNDCFDYFHTACHITEKASVNVFVLDYFFVTVQQHIYFLYT